MIAPDIRATSASIMALLAEQMSDMIKNNTPPPPEGLFVLALSSALQGERDRCAGIALRRTSDTEKAHLIRSGAR